LETNRFSSPSHSVNALQWEWRVYRPKSETEDFALSTAQIKNMWHSTAAHLHSQFGF
jgi:hypothetical protein